MCESLSYYYYYSAAAAVDYVQTSLAYNTHDITYTLCISHCTYRYIIVYCIYTRFISTINDQKRRR